MSSGTDDFDHPYHAMGCTTCEGRTPPKDLPTKLPAPPEWARQRARVALFPQEYDPSIKRSRNEIEFTSAERDRIDNVARALVATDKEAREKMVEHCEAYTKGFATSGLESHRYILDSLIARLREVVSPPEDPRNA